MNPSSSCLAQAKTHPLVQPCTMLKLPLPHFSPLPCLKSQRSRPAAHQPQFGYFITSSSLSLLWFPQRSLLVLSSLVLGSTLSGLHLLCPPSPSPQASALSVPNRNHTTQSKLASRFLGLACECECVSLPSPKHRWTCRECCQILLV